MEISDYQKIDGYNFQILYINPMIITKKISVACTEEEMRRKSNSAKEGSKQGNEGQQSYKTQKAINKMAIVSPSLSEFTLSGLNFSVKIPQVLPYWRFYFL